MSAPGSALKRDLARRWAALWQRLGLRGEPGPELAAILAAYAAPGRHYHGLAHLGAVLRDFDAVRPLADDPDACELALWFHDVVWSADGTDCEARSAERARALAGRHGLDAARAGRVAGMILATTHRAPATGDAGLVQDVDLAILAAAPADFDTYDAAIRREYAHVPEPAFRAGRAAVLEGFLRRPAIYATPALRERLEAPARSNLERALRRCRAGA